MPDDTADIASTLAFFGQLGKGVDDLKTKIASLNEASSAMKKITDETEKFGQTISRHTRTTFRGMEEGALNLTRLIGGAGGLALSLAGAAKTLDSFAVSSLQTRNFAINTGFSTEALKSMRVQLSAAGMSANEAAQSIGNIGGKLQEVLALQETSGFYKSLQASSPALAEQVRQLMNAGKEEEARNVLQEAFNKGGERFKAWLPTVTGVSRAAWEAQKQGMEGLIQPWKFNVEEAAKYHKTMVNLGTIFDSTWTSMTYTVLEGLNNLIGGDKGFEKLNSKAHEFADNFKKWINDSVIPEIKRTFQTVQDIINWFEGRQIKGLPGALTPEEFLKRQREEKKDFNIFEWLGNQIFTPAHASTDEGRGALLEQETEKDSSKMFIEIRDYMQKWDNEREGIGVGANGPGGGSTGGSAGGAAGSSSGDGSGTPSAGSPAALNDENGKKIDAETMREAERLGRAGDVAGLQKLFSQRGYHMSGPACGIVATGYVKSAGFKPPTGAAIATSWHKWGEALKPEDINAPNRPFGSMVATYFHGRYGGTQGRILAPGETGGHVMTVIPGTYNKKDNSAMFVDQSGKPHRRNLADMDPRYAGDEAVKAVQAQRGEQRDKIDKANGSVWDKPTASVNVSVKNAPPGVRTNAEADGAFKTLNMSRTNQLVYN